MSILEKIAAYKRAEVAAAKALMPQAEIEARASKAGPVRPFRGALEQKKARGQVGLIAEVKKASPSKGLIRVQFDPPALARAYEAGGAACLSVLTDAPSFQGAPEFLTQARAATALPCLRKDFMLEAYQVVEARAWGADCILVILAMAGDREARILMDEAARWGMDALIEVHDEAELARAVALGANMIGINNRDLKSFVIDLSVTLRLAPLIPKDVLAVAESGLSTPADLRQLAESGVSSVLIGESLMREADVEGATKALLGGKIDA